MTSMAPLKVAGLMEFHVLDTEPEIDRTYCIPFYVGSAMTEQGRMALMRDCGGGDDGFGAIGREVGSCG